MKIRILLWLTLLSLSLSTQAHEAAIGGEMAGCAQRLLAALEPPQKEKVLFPLTDAERRNWHFIPRARKGLPIKEMTQGQRLLAQALLVSGLSSQGYEKAVGIMSLEVVLLELEKGKGPVRDPENYFVTIFGTPGGAEPWGWRVEGHHLSLNFAAAGNDVLAMTPSFFGSNPGEVRTGPREKTRFLAEEEDLGRALVKSLSDEQRGVAVILATAPKDILNVPGRNDWTKPEGLTQGKMGEGQKAALRQLIELYLHRHRGELAAAEWAKIEQAGLEGICFAWAGELEPGQPHYYRVQGPTFVIEYDNTQNNANHVHSVWRSLTNDFGEDLLKAHYERAHAAL